MNETSKDEEFRIRKAISAELEPFITEVLTLPADSKQFKIFRQAYSYFERKYKEKWQIFGSIIEGELGKSSSGTLYQMLLYLGIMESVGNTLIDLVVMLLVASGRDLHIECKYTPRIRHALSMEDLEDKENPVSLGTKLNFLRDNNLSELPSIVDTSLRNDIAHMNFQIKENQVYIKGKPAYSLCYRGSSRLGIAFQEVEQELTHLAQRRALSEKKGDVAR